MFTKATKKESKLRLLIQAISGGGKTYTSLSIAEALGKNIFLIDTEEGSASKYADRFDFQVCNLSNHSVDSYISAIQGAEKLEADVLIIDSISHEWEWLKAENEKIATRQFKGNTWSAWSVSNEIHKKFIQAILSFKGHIICTSRTKTAWDIQKNDNGRNIPVRIGQEPETGKNIEYEFDMVCELDQENSLSILKDRLGLAREVYFKPDRMFGEKLLGLLSGEKAYFSPNPNIDEIKAVIIGSNEQTLPALKQELILKSKYDSVALAFIKQRLEELGKEKNDSSETAN